MVVRPCYEANGEVFRPERPRYIRTKLSYALYTLLAVVLTSCYSDEPIKNHKGGIVHYKASNIANGGRFKLEKDGKFLTVYITDYDYKRYNVGDTIK